jgi:hypothetical protein
VTDFRHSKRTQLLIGGSDVSEFCNKAETSASTDTADASVFRRDWKNATLGSSAVAISVGGWYDVSNTAIANLLGVEAGAVLTLGHVGLDNVGDPAVLLRVKSTSEKHTAPLGGTVAFEWGAVAQGAVGFGVTLHSASEETVDGSEGYHTGPVGGSATGAILHLHVLSVSAADSIVVTVEHSTNHVDWTTLDTFTAATAAGAQRRIVTGTVNRYTRVSWDISGTDPSITFAVALART